jgi:hypothetical protein
MLILIAALTHSSFSLTRIPVFVLVRTNLPATALGPSKIVRVPVPYSQANDKMIDQADVNRIKNSIPWAKTTLLLYHPYHIQIESSTEARVAFRRGRRVIVVTMQKTEKGWQPAETSSIPGAYFSIKPPGIWDRISDALPF